MLARVPKARKREESKLTHKQIASFLVTSSYETRNNGMIGTFPRRDTIRVTFFEREVATSVLKGESATSGNSESSESSVVGLNVGASVTVLVGSCEKDGVGGSDGCTFVDDGT